MIAEIGLVLVAIVAVVLLVACIGLLIGIKVKDG